MDWTRDGIVYETKIEVYDIETGEQITKNHVIKKLYTIKSKDIKWIQNEHRRTKIIKWFCEPNKQTRIEFK